MLATGGNAFVSVPVGRPRVSFNGLRVFAATEVLALFAGLELRRMALVDAPGDFIQNMSPDSADIHESAGAMDSGLSLFWFTKQDKQ